MIDREKAAQMRRDGATYAEIGAAFGVSRQRAAQVLDLRRRCSQDGRRVRKCSTDMEKIVYEGIYNWMMDHPNVTYPALTNIMFGHYQKESRNTVVRLLHGKDSKIPKRAYDRLMAATGMTYEQLFKLRDGFKEEDDG